MGRRIQLKSHHTPDELRDAYRAEQTSVRARQIQVVWMVSQGLPTKQILSVTGLCRSWVYSVCRRYNEEGLAGLGDRRSDNGGHGRLLDDEGLDELRALLDGPPPDGGLWTSPKVAAWMSKKLDREVSFKVAWTYMTRLGFSLQVPRPSHASGDEETKEAFKKGGSRKPSKKY